MRLKLIFVALCLAWGSTWLAIKIGVGHAPPLWFAGTRFFAAGCLMLAYHRVRRGPLAIPRGDLLRALAVGAVAVGVTFGLIFWGEQYVASGITGVLAQGLVPIGLYGFAVAFGHDAFRFGRAAGIALGVCGLLVLSAPAVHRTGHAHEVSGIAAIAVGTLAYCVASVASRDVLRRTPALLMSGLENLAGGLGLMLVSLPLEGGRIASDATVRGAVVLSWLYLVVVGSLVGFTSYVLLLKEWGAARVSHYAFFTPVIALALGAALYGEHFGLVELAGAAIILVGVWTTRERTRPAPLPSAAAAPSARSQDA